MQNNIIKFSHKNFNKFNGSAPKSAILIAINTAYYDDIPDELIEYDIMYNFDMRFKINKFEKYIILVFLDYENNNIFTTLRNYADHKYMYYNDRIFQKFEVVYE